MAGHFFVRHQPLPEQQSPLPLAKSHDDELLGQQVAFCRIDAFYLQQLGDRADLMPLKLQASDLAQLVELATFPIDEPRHLGALRRK